MNRKEAGIGPFKKQTKMDRHRTLKLMRKHLFQSDVHLICCKGIFK